MRRAERAGGVRAVQVPCDGARPLPARQGGHISAPPGFDQPEGPRPACRERLAAIGFAHRDTPRIVIGPLLGPCARAHVAWRSPPMSTTSLRSSVLVLTIFQKTLILNEISKSLARMRLHFKENRSDQRNEKELSSERSAAELR